MQSVFVTAGASAAEHLVREVIQTLVNRYGGSVEERQVISEQETHFELPISLRRLESAPIVPLHITHAPG